MGATVSSHIKQCSGRSVHCRSGRGGSIDSGACVGCGGFGRDNSSDNSDGQASTDDRSEASDAAPSRDPPAFSVAHRRTVKVSWVKVEERILEVSRAIIGIMR